MVRRLIFLLLLPLLLGWGLCPRSVAQVVSRPPKPSSAWSDLEPVLQRARWVVVARVERVQTIGRLGIRVSSKLIEKLFGPRDLPPRFQYLDGIAALVVAGDEEILFLAPPEPGGIHLQILGRVGGRDPLRADKLSWLREVLELRALPVRLRGRAFVDFYAQALLAESVWNRSRALRELERLLRSRPIELRALLDPEQVIRARSQEKDANRKRRLEALAQGLRAAPPKAPPRSSMGE